MFDNKIDRVGNANEHTDQKISEKDGTHFYYERKELLTALPVDRQDHFGFGKIIPCTDQDHGQHTIRKVPDQRSSKQDSKQ
jgi:hypothetical protein